ncbi:MAG: hypothetical protein JO260_09455 [Acidobacteria bacterium]|nr:hypothetical protein [Acidobacteriota bacterium]
MANQPDQGQEANPIAEIFDEMFTLLQDLEARSVAVLEYMKEQGGVTDENFAPYLDRAGAASDVRWRAARARMDHLLAPKPKSATEVAKDEKPKGESQPQTKEKEAKGLGKELAATQAGSAQQSGSRTDDKSKEANAADAKSKPAPSDHKQNKEPPTTSTTAETQASALAGAKLPETQKTDDSKNPEPQQPEDEKSASQSPGSEQPHTQKAAN